MPHPAAIPFVLRDESIELSQLLKATGACDTGGGAKHAVQGGEVTVNGQRELRRGRTLKAGDLVVYRGKAYEVRPAPGSPSSGG